MNRFRKILVVDNGLDDDSSALREALLFAAKNSVELRAMIVAPELPPPLERYQTQFAESLRRRLKEQAGAQDVEVEVEFGAMPAVRIVRHALQHSIDLIIKTVESTHADKGVSAVDLSLLRKSPIPVWLTRPKSHDAGTTRLGVAIDPTSPNPAAHRLSVHLLRVARQLANAAGASLEVVSCWNYEYENYLRGNRWMSMTDDEIDAAVRDAELQHRTRLDELLLEADIGDALTVRRIRGRPSEKIPEFVETHAIDLLVMGTVARSGLRGFVMGNTAEGILHGLGCSLVAFKPDDFVSPLSDDD